MRQRCTGGYAWPANRERNRGIFPVWRGFSRRQAMLAKMVAVVGSKEDVGIVQLPRGLQPVDCRVHEIPHRQHVLQAKPPGFISSVYFKRRERRKSSYIAGLVRNVTFVP